MNINIAFNTIIYIMVFLFPGVLFRRVFFSGKLIKSFDSGNAFERILYYLFLSMFCLTLFCLFTYSINYLSKEGVPVLNYFDSEILINSFISIYKNEFPQILQNVESLLQLTYLLFSLYLFSSLIGYLSNKTVFIFGLEKRWSIFRFLNNWEYLSYSSKTNNINHKIGDIYTTKIDISSNNDCLYTGRLHEVIIDKDGSVEAYALIDTFQFHRLSKLNPDDLLKIEEIKSHIKNNNPLYVEHIETTTKYVYLKRIKGNIFTINADRVENTSLTFVKISGIYKRVQSFSKTVFNSILVLSIVFAISYGFWDYGLVDFESQFKRIGFCIIFPLSVASLLIFILGFFEEHDSSKKYWFEVFDKLYFIILFLAPYFYVFGNLPFYWFVLIDSVLLIIYALWSNDEKDDKLSKAGEKLNE